MLGLICDKLCNSQPYKKKKSDLNFREGSSIMSVFYPRPLPPFSKGKIENLEYSRFSFLPFENENLEYSRFKQNSKSGVTKIMKLPLKRLKFHLLQIFIFKRQNCESGVLQNLIFLLQNFKSGVLQIFIFIKIWSD